MLVGFGGMFNRLAFVFNDPLEDMSHGWLVPVFSLYVLWTQRKEIREAVGAPSFWGFLACLPCIGVALVGSRGIQVRLEQVGFIGLCLTLPWAFFGRRVAKLCLFPALFLLFTVPMSSYLDAITIHLRLFASGTAFVLLRGFGVDVVQQGTAIVSQGAHPFSIDVAEPCSGLRSIVALTALTAAYAWYTQPTWRRRAALFACAVPHLPRGGMGEPRFRDGLLPRLFGLCGVYCGDRLHGRVRGGDYEGVWEAWQRAGRPLPQLRAKCPPPRMWAKCP